MKTDKKALSKALQELPEWTAQKKMAPGQNPLYRKVPKEHKLASVMALIYPEQDGADHILLIQRALNDNDRHGGQLGLPGGKYEPEDGTMLACALREVHEEIGIAPDLVTIVGPLSPLYVFASNFYVYPYVGLLDQKPRLTLQESEVQRVISLSVAALLDENTKGTTDIQLSGTTIPEVPYYAVDGRVLWGATAMIMSELEAVIYKTL